MKTKLFRNRKGLSEVDGIKLFFVGVFGIVLFVYVAILILGTLSDDNLIGSDIKSSQTYFISEQSNDISPVGSGITSNSITTPNDTWLNFDGINDYVRLTYSSQETISFWYKNSSKDWTHIVNSSGTLYVNGVEDTPEIYPVYSDGVYIYIGKLGESSFFNGSIDEIRIYGFTLSPSLINTLYSNGR